MGTSLTQRRRAAKRTENGVLVPLHFFAPLRLCVSIWLILLHSNLARSHEIDPIRVALIVDGMASRGSGYDATELHGLGVEGLAAVLDHLLPDTAPPMPPMPKGPPEEDIRR